MRMGCLKIGEVGPPAEGAPGLGRTGEGGEVRIRVPYIFCSLY